MNGRFRKVTAFLVGVGVMALVILQMYTLVTIRQTQVDNTAKVDNTAEAVRLIKDCTDPSGDCYQRGQKRTAEAIVGINEGTLHVVVAALSCQADGITEREALARCTIERSKP